MDVKVKGLFLALLIVGIFVTLITTTQATAYTSANGNITQAQLQNRNRNRIWNQVCQNTGEEECTSNVEDPPSLGNRHRTQTQHMNQEGVSKQLGELSQEREHYRHKVQNLES